jgi:hypothetical protein
MLETIQLTAAIIRVSSIKTFGVDHIVMWEGNPWSVGCTDISELDGSKLTILNAKKYQYANNEIIYSYGKAMRIKGKCSNLNKLGDQCACTGACMTDVEGALAIDDNYFRQII